MTDRICGVVKERVEAAGLWGAGREESEEPRTHLIAAEPFPLSKEQLTLLNRLGPALVKFYEAVNDLYLRSGPEWVREYLDAGKGDDLVRHAAMKYQKHTIPGIIRPDILMTPDGFAITELDSVPGGFGRLDCLSQAYEQEGWELIGSPRGIRDGFAAMLRSVAGKDDPVCAIIVSDESVDYLPEMVYIAGELREIGLSAFTVRPREVTFTEEGLFIDVDGEKLHVDLVYRFFELFDLLNIPKSELISYAARKKLVVVTPPYKHFLEEKSLLAMIHNESLRDYWALSLGEEDFDLLRRITAPTWVLDPRPVPPHAEISGFRWKDKPIRDWREIVQGTQKERRMIIKPSGFSPLAWGARGVKVGHDMPQEEWTEAVEEALNGFYKLPYVLQPFQETDLFGVTYFSKECEGPYEMETRVRLCPYYFVVDGQAKLGGVLATAYPKDKKLIHGMVDAVMTPCRLG